MEEVRAFIAVELPAELKSELSRLIAKLRPGHERSVKWVDPEGIHLTLKFLGNVSTEKIVDITQAIESASTNVRPFSLEMDGLGAFPNLKLPRVAWVGVSGDIRIVTGLQKKIDESLVPLGFSPEAKAFSPHLTL
ncbi:MAG: RNA 2',3'-cyclic phosphodiesterase, partial [Chloroflexi bacterium]|nr:RNA 2',3'-cyclic phosphodiesterase [Chloroflexota bacterium]